MSLALAIFIATITLAIGLALGILGTRKLLSHGADTMYLDHLELFNYHVGHIKGRWAVMRDVDGVPKMIGQSHETLRGAINAAIDLMISGDTP